MPHWTYAALSIAATLAFSAVLIRSSRFRAPISIFVVLFLAGQAMAYTLDIEFLKVNVPSRVGVCPRPCRTVARPCRAYAIGGR